MHSAPAAVDAETVPVEEFELLATQREAVLLAVALKPIATLRSADALLNVPTATELIPTVPAVIVPEIAPVVRFSVAPLVLLSKPVATLE
jgi:hypothetical protein